MHLAFVCVVTFACIWWAIFDMDRRVRKLEDEAKRAKRHARMEAVQP